MYCQGFVTVLAGPHKTTFTIHRGLLSRTFKYFHVLLDGVFIEAFTDSVTLSEEDPAIFEIVHNWLYTARLEQPLDGEDQACSFQQLVKVYLFADKFQSEALRITAIDQLILRIAAEKRYLPDPAYVYAHTTARSPLRNLLVATFAQDPSSLAKLLQAHPEFFLECPESLTDIVVAMVARKGALDTLTMSKAPFVWDFCAFHNHESRDRSRCRQMWIEDADEDVTTPLTLEGRDAYISQRWNV